MTPPALLVAATVLATVNAPYRVKLDAQGLVNCLLDPTMAVATPGHMSSFFGDVDPDLQVAFADLFGMTEEQLKAAAKAFELYAGYPAKSYPLAA
jgi:hypothetical protein